MENTEAKSDSAFKIGEYLTYVGPFVIYLGMVRLIVFYNSFGIPIVSYLDFSEIITSFFDILLFVILAFVYGSIQSFLTHDKDEVEKWDAKRQKIYNEDGAGKLFLLYLKYLLPLIIGGVIVVGLIGILYFVLHSITFLTALVIVVGYAFLLGFIVLSVQIQRVHIRSQSNSGRKRFIFFIFHFLVFTIFLMYYSSYQAGLIKSEKSTYGVTIIFDNDQKIISDSTDYYIGKTQNYVFIYHEKPGTTDVFPMSRIKQITMRKSEVK